MRHDHVVDIVLSLGIVGVLFLGVTHIIWPEYFMKGWNWKGSYLKNWHPHLVRLFGAAWIGFVFVACIFWCGVAENSK
jgi:hypothetical protein